MKPPETAQAHRHDRRLVMIEMRGIKKIYEVGDEEVHALDGVDLTIRDREFVAIIGAVWTRQMRGHISLTGKT